MIKELNSMGLVEESDGARVIFVEGFSIPRQIRLLFGWFFFFFFLVMTSGFVSSLLIL